MTALHCCRVEEDDKEVEPPSPSVRSASLSDALGHSPKDLQVLLKKLRISISTLRNSISAQAPERSRAQTRIPGPPLQSRNRRLAPSLLRTASRVTKDDNPSDVKMEEVEVSDFEEESAPAPSRAPVSFALPAKMAECNLASVIMNPCCWNHLQLLCNACCMGCEHSNRRECEKEKLPNRSVAAAFRRCLRWRISRSRASPAGCREPRSAELQPPSAMLRRRAFRLQAASRPQLLPQSLQRVSLYRIR